MTSRQGAQLGLKWAFIPQNPYTSLNPVKQCGAQVLEQLGHSGQSRDQNRKKTLDTLSAVGFEDAQRVFKAYPFELSGGQLQTCGACHGYCT